MADLAKANQIVADVNQQLRFEEGVAAYKMVSLGSRTRFFARQDAQMGNIPRGRLEQLVQRFTNRG